MGAHRLNPPAIATGPSTIDVILKQHVEDGGGVTMLITSLALRFRCTQADHETSPEAQSL
jgi:hypothetical protein